MFQIKTENIKYENKYNYGVHNRVLGTPMMTGEEIEEKITTRRSTKTEEL